MIDDPPELISGSVSPLTGASPADMRDVVDHLERERRQDAEHQVGAEPVLGQPRRLQRPDDHEQIEAERHDDADEPLLLGQHREDEVVPGHRQEAQLPLCALENPLPHVPPDPTLIRAWICW